MKYLLAFLCFCFTFIDSFAQQKQPKAEIVVIGSIHQAVPNFNADTLYRILERIKPDVLLVEMDSSFFTADFQFKFPSKENEQNATVQYLQKHPKAIVRPFEFEGRNEYRRARGMVPTDNLSIKLVNQLYEAGALSPQHQAIVKAYHGFTDSLKVVAAKSPVYFNNPSTDSLAERRQFYQHKKLTEITNQREEFASTFHTMPNGQRISYRDGYQLWADFWDLRNQTMARNIMTVARRNPGKRIVVLTGFLHRYYLLSQLHKLIQGKNIQIREFYDYTKQ